MGADFSVFNNVPNNLEEAIEAVENQKPPEAGPGSAAPLSQRDNTPSRPTRARTGSPAGDAPSHEIKRLASSVHNMSQVVDQLFHATCTLFEAVQKNNEETRVLLEELKTRLERGTLPPQKDQKDDSPPPKETVTEKNEKEAEQRTSDSSGGEKKDSLFDFSNLGQKDWKFWVKWGGIAFGAVLIFSFLIGLIISLAG